MARLYVSDLDGTLLRSDATLSEFSRAHLTRLLDDGLAFTVASARSVVAMQQLLGPLPLRLPVIEMNGAIISDLATGRHETVFAIEGGLLRELYAFVVERGHMPFISSVDGGKDYLHYSELRHEGMRWYVEDRKAARDDRLRPVPDLTETFDNDIVCVTLVDRRAVMEELIAALAERFPAALAMNFFENAYSPGWFWLTIHDRRATKDRAVGAVAEAHGFALDDVVVFGDHWNDLAMFQAAGTAVAVANAAEELKAHASVVIGSNDEDSVVRYLLEHWP